MFIRLDKEDSFYRSGETVKGTVFFELFHQSAQNELFIKFEGVQIVPKHIKTMIESGIDELEDESVSSQAQSELRRIVPQDRQESIESFRGYQQSGN